VSVSVQLACKPAHFTIILVRHAVTQSVFPTHAPTCTEQTCQETLLRSNQTDSPNITQWFKYLLSNMRQARQQPATSMHTESMQLASQEFPTKRHYLAISRTLVVELLTAKSFPKCAGAAGTTQQLPEEAPLRRGC
jgi:hypothetical protein